MSRKAFVVSGLGRIITTAGLVLGTADILAAAQNGVAARTTAEQKQSRYQIGVMERVLEGAVEHGATVTRDRLQAVLPAQMLLSENTRSRKSVVPFLSMSTGRISEKYSSRDQPLVPLG